MQRDIGATSMSGNVLIFYSTFVNQANSIYDISKCSFFYRDYEQRFLTRLKRFRIFAQKYIYTFLFRRMLRTKKKKKKIGEFGKLSSLSRSCQMFVIEIFRKFPKGCFISFVKMNVYFSKTRKHCGALSVK